MWSGASPTSSILDGRIVAFRLAVDLQSQLKTELVGRIWMMSREVVRGDGGGEIIAEQEVLIWTMS